MYEKYPYLCISAFCFCILAYCLSPREDMSVRIENVSAHSEKVSTEKTTTAFPENISSWTGTYIKSNTNTWGNDKPKTSTWKLQRIHESIACDANCKVETLIKLWMNEKIAWSLVYTCKDKAKDPRHCIIAWSSILKAESNFWNKCNGNNCFWVGGWRFKYETLEKWVEDWIYRYNKYWYKAKSAWHFYPPKWWVSPSRYCTSENSSNSSVWCPNWRKHASYIWNKLDSKF